MARISSKFFLFASLLLVVVACGEKPRIPAPDAPVLQFVGSASCAGCHQSAYDDWQGSHHELAIQIANSSTVLGDFDNVEFDYFAHRTQFTRRGEEFLVRTEDAQGLPREFKIAYTFGVTPLQQYLVEFPGGRLQALPFAWDARAEANGGQRWYHLYPDEYVGPGDALYWTGRYQNWNYMCAECHSTNLDMGYDAATDTFATTYSELPVGCEACHGPGSVHAAQAENSEFDERYGFPVDLSENATKAWIMNVDSGIASRGETLGELPQEVESCGRCHSRRGIIATEYEYGKPLTDTHLPALLDEHLYFADGQIQDEVFVYGSFVQSRMYRAGVTCSNCHNPHSGGLLTGPVSSDVCAQCHLPAVFATTQHSGHALKDAACVDCHMPPRTYMVVDDRRDHSFRIPRPDLQTETGAPSACENCHADRDAAWFAAGLEDSHPAQRPHYGSAIAAGRRSGGNAVLSSASTNSEFPAIARATALTMLAPPLDVTALKALESALADPDPLLRIAALGALRDAPAELRSAIGGDALFDPVRSVRIEAARTFAGQQDLLPLGQARAYGAAAAEYRASQTMLSSTPDALVNLGNFELAEGDLDRASAYFEQALQRDPSFTPARLNLVDAIRRNGNQARIYRLLQEGIEIAPDDAALRHSMGLALIRIGQRDAALGQLRDAVRLNPEASRYVYVLGVALNSTGEQQEALHLLEGALQRSPADYDIGWALATMLRDGGELERARQIASQLAEYFPDDANLATLRESLQGQPN